MKTKNKIRLLTNSFQNVHLNLAAEQSILKLSSKIEQNTVRLWYNPPSVILGRTQQLEDEVNVEYCKRYNIVIARRISGGGCVYHDKGNLNLSFFLPNKLLPVENNIISITEYFTDFLKETFSRFGIPKLEREGHSNIFSKGRKISGSAAYMRKGWYLHHATLLHSSNLTHLENSLLARESDPQDSRKSRYFPTRNIKEFDFEEFKNHFIGDLEKEYGLEVSEGNLTPNEERLSSALTNKMYTKKEWIQNGKRTLVKI